MLDEAHRDEPDGRDEHGRAQHGSGTDLVHKAADQEHGAGGQHHEQGDIEGDFAAAPSQVFGHRLEQQADGEAGAAIEQQHQEASRQQEARRGGGSHEPIPATPPVPDHRSPSLCLLNQATS